MNILDLLILVLLVAGLLSGMRAGFLAPVLGLIGAALGFAIALLLASVFREQLAEIEQPLRAVATLAVLAMFVMLGEASGAALGATMSRSIHR
ncbi:MAG: CvpA family protein, partial [Chloroflexi bacterium]|nr:CvpA family protein [Chloroflexota bacterium]